MTRNQVFISYSHEDRKWLQELQTMLAPLLREDQLLLWDDTRIKPGDRWHQEIETALQTCAVAVLMISPDFLASRYIAEVELPALLKAAEEDQLKVCWFVVSDCLYDRIAKLTVFQAAHDPKQPLDALKRSKLNSILADIARTILGQYESMAEQPQPKEAPEPHPPVPGPERPVYDSSAIFLSYHSGDGEKAQQIGNALQNAGFPVWRDQESLQVGAQFSIAIEQAIRRSTVVITLITRAATESTWVRNEILFAQEYKKIIVPLLMEQEAKLPIEIFGTQYINMAADETAGMEKLCSRVGALLQSAPVEQGKSALEPAVAPPSRSTQNPFIFGNAVPADLFVERKSALDTIASRVGNFYSLQSISLVANRRMGKTSLLNYIWKKPGQVFPPDHSYITIYMDAMDARTQSISGFMRILRKSIEKQLGSPPWAESDDGNLTVFSEAIQEIAEEDEKRIVLLLDEFESVMAYQELDILLETLRASGAQSRIGMIVSTAHLLSELEAAGKLSSLFYNIFQTHFLGRFTEAEYTDLVKRAFARSGETTTEEEIRLIGELSGRHPFLVQLAGSLVWKARRERWKAETIRAEFKQGARDIFGGILQRLEPGQLNLVKRLSGLAPAEPTPDNIVTELRLRGVLDENNVLFSRSFGEYVREELR
jgi:hypothetical protein